MRILGRTGVGRSARPVRRWLPLAVVAVMLLGLAAAGRHPFGGAGNETATRDVTSTTQAGRAIQAPPVTPPPGAVAASTALAELSATGATMGVDAAGHLVSVTAAPATKLPTGDAEAFTRRYAAALGVPRGSALHHTTTDALDGGDQVVRYQQEFGGVPVLGGQVVVTADSRGQVLAANAETVSTAPATTAARVNAATAVVTGVARAAELSGTEASQLRGAATLWLYDPAVLGAPGSSHLRPTWWVKIGGLEGDAIASVLVDATDGTVTLAFSEQEAATNRIVCDLNNVRVNLNNLNTYACNATSAGGLAPTTRHEGGPTSTVDQVNKTYDYLGATLAFYSANFGRNSYDGKGGQIRATTRACQVNPSVGTIPCPYPNAFWNSYQLVVGDTFATDDVIGHEFTHAVTEHSSQLFYLYQSGAINEAISDIMGEFVDQSYNGPGEDTSKLWLVGEDLPVDPSTGVRELRDMSNPERLFQPWTVYGNNWSSLPPSNRFFDNGGVHTNSGPANYAAYLIAHGGTTPFGVTVAGIGVAKSQQLWYRVMHQLTSGADYIALGSALWSSCLQLVGHGLTRADCAEVNRAADATNMNVWDSPRGACGGKTGLPVVVSDDLESRTGWGLTPGVWEYIPDPDIPVRFAYSGSTALYGFAAPGQTGYAEFAQPFTTPPLTGPPAYSTWMFLKAQALTTGGGVTIEVNAGFGWQALNQLIPLPDRFYAQQQFLEPSTTYRLRLRLDGGSTGAEWLLDDFGIGVCNNDSMPVAPYAGSGVLTGTTGTVNWIAKTPNGSEFFQLSYDPAIPGAPTTVAAAPDLPQVTHTYGITLPNLDPAGTYRVSIAEVSPVIGATTTPLVVTFSGAAPLSCPTAPPQFLIIWTPHRPAPNTGCPGLVVQPRRR